MQIALKRTNIYFLQSHVRPYIGCFFHNILQRKSRKFRENWHHTANKGQIWDSDKLLDSRALLSPCTTPSLSKHERVKWQAASYHQLMGFWPGLTHPRFPSENLGSQKNLGLWFFCFLAMAVPPDPLFLPDLSCFRFFWWLSEWFSWISPMSLPNT